MQQTENKRDVLPRGMSVTDAAAYLGIHRASIYKLAKAGEVTARKVAGRTIFLRDELDRYLDALPSAFDERAENQRR